MSRRKARRRPVAEPLSGQLNSKAGPERRTRAGVREAVFSGNGGGGLSFCGLSSP
jgi:hypothetical protein